MPEPTLPNEERPGEPLEERVEDVPEGEASSLEMLEDGAAIATIEDSEEEATETGEFYDNIVDLFDEPFLDDLANRLLEDIDRDKKSREKRDEQYAEAIKRTGLGKEAPGGATFDGASKVVHPMLAQAAIDFASRAVKELLPPNGPVRMFVPGKDPSSERLQKAERKKDYMNWQFLVQMPEFRSEMEQLLTQLPLGGSQYLRLTPDYSKRRRRPCPLYVPIDAVSIPFAASNFYTAERQTFHETMTEFEFQERVKDGMYRAVDGIPSTLKSRGFTIASSRSYSSLAPQPTKAEAATQKIEGKEESGENRDGLKIVHECSCYMEFEEKDTLSDGVAPYLIAIDEPSKKIVSIVRNWEQDDEDYERMQWIIEFAFLPWRGAYSVGLGQFIGSLSGAATGALRALLDSALIANMPTLAKIKGTNVIGQSKSMNPLEIIEIEGSKAGTKDIRELLMQIPFPGPAPVLMELLSFLVDSGQSAIHIAMEKLSEGNKEMPVGTTLALIEEGMRVMAAIHLRLYHSMEYVIRVLHRIDRMYATEDEMLNDIGEVLAHREDFEGPLDCVPVADPEVFSDVQRIAQAQIVADRALAVPDLYELRETELMLLEKAKIPNRERLLKQVPKPVEMNQVNENLAMTLGRPVAAFPEQDHLGHLQVLLDFLTSPMLGQLPVIAPTFIPAALQHMKEHIVYWYVNEFYSQVRDAAESDDEGMDTIMAERDPEVRKELDKTLAVASKRIVARATELFKQLPPIIQQAQQILAQFAPPSEMPMDPNKMAAVEAKKQGDQLRSQTEDKKIQARSQEKIIDLQARREERGAVSEVEFAKLSVGERQAAIKAAQADAQQANEIAARLEELARSERAEDERAAAKIASDELRNTQDNATAIRIAAAEIEEKGETALSTGAGIDPSGEKSR